jgi:hypothetical protein
MLFGDCFGIYSIVCLYANVWSVEYEQFVDFADVEDFQDPEQFPKLVEGKSLLHSRLSYYNMHFNYTAIYYCFVVN